MAFWDKIAGTIESWFGLGSDPDIAVGMDDMGNLLFKDKNVAGEKTLSDLTAGGFDPNNLILTVNGGLVYDNNETLVTRT